eukprot:2124410-Pleurochrysis_carterae.AAC.3
MEFGITLIALHSEIVDDAFDSGFERFNLVRQHLLEREYRQFPSRFGAAHVGQVAYRLDVLLPLLGEHRVYALLHDAQHEQPLLLADPVFERRRRLHVDTRHRWPALDRVRISPALDRARISISIGSRWQWEPLLRLGSRLETSVSQPVLFLRNTRRVAGAQQTTLSQDAFVRMRVLSQAMTVRKDFY